MGKGSKKKSLKSKFSGMASKLRGKFAGLKGVGKVLRRLKKGQKPGAKTLARAKKMRAFASRARRKLVKAKELRHAARVSFRKRGKKIPASLAKKGMAKAAWRSKAAKRKAQSLKMKGKARRMTGQIATSTLAAATLRKKGFPVPRSLRRGMKARAKKVMKLRLKSKLTKLKGVRKSVTSKVSRAHALRKKARKQLMKKGQSIPPSLRKGGMTKAKMKVNRARKSAMKIKRRAKRKIAAMPKPRPKKIKGGKAGAHESSPGGKKGPASCKACFKKGQVFCKDGTGYCVAKKGSRGACKNDATLIKKVVGCKSEEELGENPIGHAKTRLSDESLSQLSEETQELDKAPEVFHLSAR